MLDNVDFLAEYAVDLVGNRLSKTVDKRGAVGVDEAFAYDYDLNDRLLRAQKDVIGTTTGDETTFYEYGGGNLTTVWTGETVYGALYGVRSAKLSITHKCLTDFDAQVNVRQSRQPSPNNCIPRRPIALAGQVATQLVNDQEVVGDVLRRLL